MPGSPYRLQFTREAAKDIRRLRAWETRVRDALAVLTTNPYQGHILQGSLKGARSLEFSLPSGEHRAVYFVLSDDGACLVFLVAHHEGVYDEATRRCNALRKSGKV
jgi:mRNA-degrading endonuclease RelE of RelBE toxin-antitoxin system